MGVRGGHGTSAPPLTIVKTIKITELKNRLSEYLRRVQRGESILVCDRDRVIARIEPVGGRRTRPRERSGVAGPAGAAWSHPSWHGQVVSAMARAPARCGRRRRSGAPRRKSRRAMSFRDSSAMGPLLVAQQGLLSRPREGLLVPA